MKPSTYFDTSLRFSESRFRHSCFGLKERKVWLIPISWRSASGISFSSSSFETWFGIFPFSNFGRGHFFLMLRKLSLRWGNNREMSFEFFGSTILEDSHDILLYFRSWHRWWWSKWFTRSIDVPLSLFSLFLWYSGRCSDPFSELSPRDEIGRNLLILFRE